MLFDVGEPKTEPKTKKQEKSEARVQKIADRNSAFSDAEFALLNDVEMLARFFGEMSKLFRAMEGEPTVHPRRPNISLRLIADGEPPAKLIVLPGWNQVKKTLDREWMTCELLTEKTVETDKGPGKEWKQILGFGFGVATPRVGMIRREKGVEDVRRVLATIRSFMDDHRGVLARARDNCAICGRSLTDELSRSRGIGPECIQKAPWFTWVSGDSIIVPETA